MNGGNKMPNKLEEAGISWLIIGGLTGTLKELFPLIGEKPLTFIKLKGNKWLLPPKKEWVEEIVEAAGKAGIPVWLKDNLVPALPQALPFYVPPVISEFEIGDKIQMPLRQEMPQ